MARRKLSVRLAQRPAFEVVIDSLAQDGRGVARHTGKAVFVEGALPGERVRAQYFALHRKYDEAVIDTVLDPSPHRVTPRCAHFDVCGGCSLQHLAEDAQIAFKQAALLDALAHIGKVAPERVLEPLTAEPWHYRRKARIGARLIRKNGQFVFGFRERRTNLITPVERCPVLHASVSERVGALGRFIATLDAAGTVAQVEVAVGDEATALTFRHLAPLSALDLERLRGLAAETGFAVYLQPGAEDTVAPLVAPTAGLGYAHPGLGTRVAFGPLDFIQVNAAINQKMVPIALDLLGAGAGDRVLELFCGLGNFTLPLARQAREVVGVEADPGMVERARANAAANGLDNMRYHVADLYGDLKHARWLREPYDLVLLDPPRSGAREVLPLLARSGARRIVYVSCHPGTLARDAAILVQEQRFRLTAAGVMDMFPHTAHVESIAVFER